MRIVSAFLAPFFKLERTVTVTASATLDGYLFDHVNCSTHVHTREFICWP